MLRWFRRRREAGRLARADADALVRGPGEEAYRMARGFERDVVLPDVFATAIGDPSLRAALGDRRARRGDANWERDAYALCAQAAASAHARAIEIDRRAVRPPEPACQGSCKTSPKPPATYAKASSSENTRNAYGSDWRHFSGWARRHGLPALPSDPQVLGLYVAACASGAITGKPDSVATLERRISALRWNFAHRGRPE